MNKQPMSFTSWLLLAMAGIFIFCLIAAHLERPGEQRVEAAKAAADETLRRTHLAIGNSVDTPKSFEARCGKPSAIVHGVPGVDDIEADSSTTTYIYRTPPSEMHIIFRPTAEPHLIINEHLHGKRYPFTPYDGLVEMGCIPR